MSVLKNKETEYSQAASDVRYKLTQINMVNIDNKPSIKACCVLKGMLDGTTGEVDKKVVNVSIDEILDDFSTSEKGAAKTFLKALERLSASKDAELKDEAHEDSDVF